MARFARQTERSAGAGRKRGGENECPPRPRPVRGFASNGARFLSRSDEREAFCYWGFPPPNFVFHFAKCAAIVIALYLIFYPLKTSNTFSNYLYFFDILTLLIAAKFP